MNVTKLRFLNGNAIKLLACLFMLIDHVGLLLLPQYSILRVIGRLSFPLFAFALAEGCKYTRNKIKHLALLAGLAIIVQVAYYVYDGGAYMSILVTLTLATLCIYALQFFKATLFSDKKPLIKALACLPFLGMVAGTYALNMFLTIDYGFWGCMLPVFASLPDFYRLNVPKPLQTTDCLPVKVLCFSVGIILLAVFIPQLKIIEDSKITVFIWVINP